MFSWGEKVVKSTLTKHNLPTPISTWNRQLGGPSLLTFLQSFPQAPASSDYWPPLIVNLLGALSPWLCPSHSLTLTATLKRNSVCRVWKIFPCTLLFLDILVILVVSLFLFFYMVCISFFSNWTANIKENVSILPLSNSGSNNCWLEYF